MTNRVFNEDGPGELYNAEAEAPPYCDRCGGYHFNYCPDDREPEIDDTVNECPNCERPQQFKGLCASCEADMRSDMDAGENVASWERIIRGGR